MYIRLKVISVEPFQSLKLNLIFLTVKNRLKSTFLIKLLNFFYCSFLIGFYPNLIDSYRNSISFVFN
ncbi:hypothetical protein AVI54_10660 [Piscirickettsia salmonis]|nr:hypothetical protein PSLF89_03620 [Piscirickettsia salmonis LF-89 = ATCC VR-1361]ALY01574.1 hypothetical protein AWE47_00725 [Piscirickettsia salmonis]APS64206.1 hypothetical protein AVI54_10660 [Piscirickettsia salmonis]APS72249.1 hypothetical protein AVM70_00725 [Piscirickettsia salmonis]APS77213.1 hypothetical protein AVM74_10685 [Piscirickettsia salmonis]